MGCQSLGSMAKEAAVAVIEREKPRIRAAIAEAKEKAITVAKEKVTEVKEKIEDRIQERAAFIAQKPDKSNMENLENLLYGLLGLGGVSAGHSVMTESRKKQRDLKTEIKNGSA